jgi:hypothetical protein
MSEAEQRDGGMAMWRHRGKQEGMKEEGKEGRREKEEMREGQREGQGGGMDAHHLLLIGNQPRREVIGVPGSARL